MASKVTAQTTDLDIVMSGKGSTLDDFRLMVPDIPEPRSLSTISGYLRAVCRSLALYTPWIQSWLDQRWRVLEK